MALTEKITILTEDSKLKSLIQQFNEGSIAASKLAAALRQLAGSTKANTEINAQVKAVQQQVAAITRTNSKAVIDQAAAYNQATAAAKKFQVTIVRTAEEAGAATGSLSAASPLGPGGEMMPGWTPPARYQAWAENFRKTHTFDEVTHSWRRMTQAELANVKATDRAAAAQRRAQIAIGRTGNRMMGGFRTALLLRSGMRELISASQLFGDSQGSSAEMINKASMAAGDAAWVYMGLASIIGGPTAGLAAGLLALTSIAGNQAAQLDKDSTAISNLDDKMHNLIATSQGLAADAFSSVDEQVKKLQADIEPSAINSLVELFQSMGRYIATGSTYGLSSRQEAQAGLIVLHRSEAMAKIAEHTTALRKAGNIIEREQLANNAEALQGTAKQYALEKARHIDRLNAIYEQKQIAGQTDKEYYAEIHKLAVLEDQLHVIKDQNIARENAAKSSKHLGGAPNGMLGTVFGLEIDQAMIAAGYAPTMVEQSRINKYINSIRSTRWRETQQYLRETDRQSKIVAKDLERAFFGITDGLMSAWSTMESIFHKSDAHVQRLFQVVRGIESIINSITSIVEDVNKVSSWLGGSSGSSKGGTNLGGIIGAGASLFGSIKGIFSGSGTPAAVHAATVAGKVNPNNAASIAKAGINAAAMIPGPQEPFVAVGAALTDFASSMHWFANGGVVKHPMIAGVGEKGHEAIIPLDKYTYVPRNRGGDSLKVELGGSITASGRDFIIGLNKAQTRMAGSRI